MPFTHKGHALHHQQRRPPCPDPTKKNMAKTKQTPRYRRLPTQTDSTTAPALPTGTASIRQPTTPSPTTPDSPATSNPTEETIIAETAMNNDTPTEVADAPTPSHDDEQHNKPAPDDDQKNSPAADRNSDPDDTSESVDVSDPPDYMTASDDSLTDSEPDEFDDVGCQQSQHTERGRVCKSTQCRNHNAMQFHL